MKDAIDSKNEKIETLDQLAKFANYSFIDKLNCDVEAKNNGKNDFQREVFSGHYVPVNPTPIEEPIYIAHSQKFFKELGFADSLAKSDDFIRLFSGDTSKVPKALHNIGWATGYALSIYGTEYYQQCPFQTGNGYGDGRAISILEVIINGKRWEMQLKGAGKTPYCRGADGRAVLRSSVREFLAQEHIHFLNISTSRSLCLFTSKTQSVQRPWFKEESYSKDPEVMIDEAIAISTRVAPSFIRVGQLELFARRARKNEHPNAMQELEKIVLHVIWREYKDQIDKNLPLEEKILLLAYEFINRLTSLVSNWIRVGYCQGNLNSDNCSVGGFTLDYGPFGFIDVFDPRYQPWTGGGEHFSFFNQPEAARQNFNMFCSALEPLLKSYPNALAKLVEIRSGFGQLMEEKIQNMWAEKLGIERYDETLFNELMVLMIETSVDYTIFFRELSSIPKTITPLQKSFYNNSFSNVKIIRRWEEWLEKWILTIKTNNSVEINATSSKSVEKLSNKMKEINPKYTLREWFLVPAYQEAKDGEYKLIEELQEVMNNPYSEQSKEIEEKYYRKKPSKFFRIAGISHVSCSS